MTYAQLVRLCLEHHRSQGVAFATAWARAMQALPRTAKVESDRAFWISALRWARPAFEAAYRLEAPGLPLTGGRAFWEGTDGVTDAGELALIRAVAELRAAPEMAPPEMIAA